MELDNERKACFRSQTAGPAAAIAAHNFRDFDEDHPAPAYLTDFARYADKRGNEYWDSGLTRADILAEYIAETEYGAKHGKFHGRANPFREAIIVTRAGTTRADMERVAERLHRELGMRPLSWALHRDEGALVHGKPRTNWHAHFVYTNFDRGEMVHIDRTRLRQAQTICSQVLGMTRGQPAEATKIRGMSHGAYKQHVKLLGVEKGKTTKERNRADNLGKELKQAIADRKQAEQARDALEKAAQARAEKQDYADKGELNRRVREALKQSQVARQEDYKVLRTILYSGLTGQALEDAMQGLVEEVYQRIQNDTPDAPIDPPQPRKARAPARLDLDQAGPNTRRQGPRRQVDHFTPQRAAGDKGSRLANLGIGLAPRGFVPTAQAVSRGIALWASWNPEEDREPGS